MPTPRLMVNGAVYVFDCPLLDDCFGVGTFSYCNAWYFGYLFGDFLIVVFDGCFIFAINLLNSSSDIDAGLFPFALFTTDLAPSEVDCVVYRCSY